MTQIRLQTIELFHCHKDAKEYEKAETCYRAIVTDTNPEKIEDSTILDLKYSFAEMLIVQKKNEEAELISKAVWKQRQVAPESEEAKKSHRQLCSIWGTLEKYRDAENMHRNIYHREPKDSWALENGDAVCRTIAEQGDYNQAQLMQDSVWQTRQKHDGQRHDLTIRSGLQRITFLEMLIHSISSAGISGTEKRLSSLRKKGFECELEVMLRSIWNTRLHPEPVPGILDAGHRLGNILFQQAKFADAEAVFLDVWEGRKYYFGDGDVNAMATGTMLGKALLRQQKPEASSKAVTIFQGILHTRQRTLEKGNCDTLSSGDDLAQAYLSLEDWLQAEAACRWVVEQKAREYGPTARETTEARWTLGQSLFKQGGDKVREAEIVLDEVYRQWNDSFPNAKATLECGHMLAELLLSQEAKPNDALQVSRVVFARREASMERDVDYLDSGRQYGCLLLKGGKLLEAEKVLKALWEHPAKGSEQETLRLKCGHLYGQSLSKQQKCSEAKEILEMVAKKQVSIFPAGGAEIEDTSQLFREVSDRCKEMEKERGKREKRRRVWR
jgi:tetratricopeptide (TPR) repeat protein